MSANSEVQQKKSVIENLTPDLATCAACLEEIFSPFSRRFRYPFTSCNGCGPRLSITQAFPYERANTTMSAFTPCGECQRECDDPEDRRYKMPANACHVCGPKPALERSDGRVICIESLTQLDDVDAATTLLQKGEILAIKGIGGYQLACDATNNDSVFKLHAATASMHRPLALMARDMAVIERFCRVNEKEKALLTSQAAPSVILSVSDREQVAPALTTGRNSLTFMLPNTGLHHLLLKRMNRPIAITTGNSSEQPTYLDDAKARLDLGVDVQYLLLHDRAIANRLDDTLMQVTEFSSVYVRSGRGYAPVVIALPPGFERSQPALAVGTDTQSSFCLLKDGRAIMSQSFSDLRNDQNFDQFTHNLNLYSQSFEHAPARVVLDLNSACVSSTFARQHATNHKAEVDQVQQQHAHIASCLVDNDWALGAGPVLGVALGGLGVSEDETLRGGEFMLADYTSCERLATFKPVRMIGGEHALRQPWLNTYAHLMAEMGWPRYKMDFEDLQLTHFFESKLLPDWDKVLASALNSPLASSCELLFDAVAAAIGIGREELSYRGYSSQALESIVNLKTLHEETEDLAYPFQVPRLGGKGIPYVEPLAMWQAVLGDLLLQTDSSIMSARFHKGLAKTIAYIVRKLCTRDDQRWINTVVLTGPIFQNKILLEEVCRRLSVLDFRVLTHQRIPTDESGLSVGQAAVSAAKSLSL